MTPLYDDAGLAAMVIGIIAMLRTTSEAKPKPSLDGWRVPAAALLVSFLLVFAYVPPTDGADGVEILVEALKHAVRVASMALGTTYLFNTGGRKIGEAITSSLRPSNGNGLVAIPKHDPLPNITDDLPPARTAVRPPEEEPPATPKSRT